MEEPWLYVVLLGAAALVYACLLPKRQSGRTSDESIIQNVEATLEQYMADIERDNDELIELVSQIKNDHSAKHSALQEQVVELRQRVIELELQSAAQVRLQHVHQSDLSSGSTQREGKIQTNLIIGHEEARILNVAHEEAIPDAEAAEMQDSIRDRYQELFSLYEQGKSIDFIAKQSGIQRGEVQLILQLAKQEDLT